VGSLVSAIVSLAHRHRGVVAAAVLGAVVVSAAGAWRLTFDADVLSLLPHNSPVIQSFRTFLARFGSLDQLYVVFTAPEGHAISDYADQVATLEDRPDGLRLDRRRNGKARAGDGVAHGGRERKIGE